MADEEWYKLTPDQKTESLHTDVTVLRSWVTNHIPTELGLHLKLILGLYAAIFAAVATIMFARH